VTPEETRAEELLSDAGLAAGIAQRLARYVAIVLRAKRRFNLTGAGSVETFVPHLLDALTLLPYAATPLIDVGSGAGLPGVPLAIAGGISVTLLDSNRKKGSFLAEALHELELAGAAIVERAERAAHKEMLREQFATATARAIGAASTALELAAPFVKVGGTVLLQRGVAAVGEAEILTGAGLMLGCSLEREISLEEGRRLLCLRKMAPTPDRFPRRTGIPAKRPLCAKVSRET